jgi:hypothetical protein
MSRKSASAPNSRGLRHGDVQGYQRGGYGPKQVQGLYGVFGLGDHRASETLEMMPQNVTREYRIVDHQNPS